MNAFWIISATKRVSYRVPVYECCIQRTPDGHEALSRRLGRTRPNPHNMRLLLVAPPRPHDVHGVERHAEPLAVKHRSDFGLQLGQHLLRFLKRANRRVGIRERGPVEGHHAEGEMHAAGVDDDRAVDAGDGRVGGEERVPDLRDEVSEGGDVALGSCVSLDHDMSKY